MESEGLGRMIRRIRRDKGLSQEQVGQGTYTRSFISQVENGQVKPSVDSLAFLAGSLDVPLAALALPFLDLEPRPRIRVQLVRLLIKTRQFEAAESVARNTLHSNPGHLLTPVLLTLMGISLLALDLLDEAREKLGEARVMARDSGDQATICESTLHLGRYASSVGKPDHAVDLYTEALGVYHQSGQTNKVRLLTLRRNRGIERMKTGDLEGAEMDYREALALARIMERFEDQAAVLMGLAMCTQRRGQLQDAEESYRASLVLYQALNMKDMVSAIYNNLGVLYEEMNQGERALDSLERSLDLKRQLSLPHRQVYTLNELGRFYLKRGDLGRARSYLEEAHAKSDPRVEDSEIATTHHIMAELARAEGDMDSACQEYDRCLLYLSRAGDIVGVARTCLLAGDLHRQRGARDEEAKILRLGLEFVFSKVNRSEMENST